VEIKIVREENPVWDEFKKNLFADNNFDSFGDKNTAIEIDQVLDRTISVVAYVDENKAGCILSMIYDDGEYYVAETNTAVVEKYRGLGIAKKLRDCFEEVMFSYDKLICIKSIINKTNPFGGNIIQALLNREYIPEAHIHLSPSVRYEFSLQSLCQEMGEDGTVSLVKCNFSF